ncbi:hypothetical protein [Leptothoe sp. PORK10 BA2]|uniref:hypothetical protein n=1 Tax=Leptothoe sp. PORK10 BA2 TaxID=3110254 RepID=UPI002B1EA958|nr:hypothetical protein [Leptothoe sp. PORK10 BA2]MEA5465369.1 hypothetical protein [Leptothoe sp. PORK10 BA2]
MVNRFQTSELPISEHLVNVWTARYLSNSVIYSHNSSPGNTANPSSYALEDFASAQGRRQTCGSFSGYVTQQSCKRAALRTKELYTNHADLDLTNVADLAKFSIEVYPVLLSFYQAHTPIVVTTQVSQPTLRNQQTKVFAIPEITKLAQTLDPFLSAFKTQHAIDTDWQTRSFLSTQLNLGNGLLLETLSIAEKILLAPYFYFLEEYAAIPWSQFFATVANHEPASPTLRVVERLLPKVTEISHAVYDQWSRLFKLYYSRRGSLDNPAVKHSSVRDFSMFQVYLWLCVLQGNLGAMERELLVLSRLMYGGIGIPWEMTVKGTKLLAKEIIDALEPHEQALVSPYTDGMVQLFASQ